MTEIVSWFCLMVVGFIVLFKLLSELYYHDHPKEYARKRKMEREKDPNIWWEEQVKQERK